MKTQKKKREYRPGVLVCREKHSTEYYWALTSKQLHEAALEILTNRFEDGWYYYPEPENDPILEVPLEQIEQLPESGLKKTAMSNYKQWKRSCKQLKEIREEYKLMEGAVEAKDGDIAWGLLRWREGEYEQMEVVEPLGERA